MRFVPVGSVFWGGIQRARFVHGLFTIVRKMDVVRILYIDAKMRNLYKTHTLRTDGGSQQGLERMQGVPKTSKTYTATEARNNFSELFDEAHFGGTVVVRKRHRRVALVSIEFMERAERLLEIEAMLEAEAAQRSLDEFHEKGGKTMEQIEKELDMD